MDHLKSPERHLVMVYLDISYTDALTLVYPNHAYFYIQCLSTYSSSTFTIVGFRSCQCQETRRQKIVGIGVFSIFYFVDDGAVCGSLKGGIHTGFGGVGLWEVSVYRGSNLINKQHTKTVSLSDSSLTCFVEVEILTGDLCL